MTTVDDIPAASEPWAGVAGGMVAAGLVIATGARLRPALGLAAAIGLAALPVAADHVLDGLLVAVALLVRGDAVPTRPWWRRGWPRRAPTCACPTLELALVVAGQWAVTGIAALVLGWPWRASGRGARRSPVVWIAVDNGGHGPAAVVGTLAVAAIDALSCSSGRRGGLDQLPLLLVGRRGGDGRQRTGRRAGRRRRSVPSRSPRQPCRRPRLAGARPKGGPGPRRDEGTLAGRRSGAGDGDGDDHGAHTRGLEGAGEPSRGPGPAAEAALRAGGRQPAARPAAAAAEGELRNGSARRSSTSSRHSGRDQGRGAQRPTPRWPAACWWTPSTRPSPRPSSELKDRIDRH